jgi:hypothetical protein
MRDEIYVSVGPIHASNYWVQDSPSLWFNVWLVTKILVDEGKGSYLWNPPLRDKTIPLEQGVEKQVKIVADELRPLCPHIIELFDQKNFPNTKEKIQIIRKNSIDDMKEMINPKSRQGQSGNNTDI